MARPCTTTVQTTQKIRDLLVTSRQIFARFSVEWHPSEGGDYDVFWTNHWKAAANFAEDHSKTSAKGDVVVIVEYRDYYRGKPPVRVVVSRYYGWPC